MNTFSYAEYAAIIDNLQKKHSIMDYSQIKDDTDNFVVIRHDVEFSVERALKMAVFEGYLGIRTSYLFQIRNNAYNLFSRENIEMVREIKNMGHYVGLHVHFGMLEDLNELADYILKEKEAIEKALGFSIDRFSYHRPPKEILQLNLNIDGLINTYSERYFEFKTQEFDNVRVKYIADSMHQWKYGYPDETLADQYSKIQMLVHPDEWTIIGLDTDANFYSLKDEKVKEFNKTIRSECKHFSKGF
jgi:hypothetical protein